MRIFIAVFLILVFLIIPFQARAADDGVIRGKLGNHTAGGSNVSGVKVTLNGTNGNSTLPSASTGTNNSGDYEFKGLSTDKSTIYSIALNYQGVDYESGDISFQAGGVVKQVDLAVFDATADSKDIKIGLSHMILLAGTAGLQAQEYYTLANTGDKSYAGSRIVQSLNQKETFTSTLPDGADSVEFIAGLEKVRAIQEQGKLIDTTAIFPGIKEIAFGYNFPYKSKELTINKTFEYPVDSFNFIIEDKGLQISGGGLVSQGPTDFNGKSFLIFTRKNIGANETLKISISGLPSGPVTGSLILWWALGIALAAAAVVIVYLRFRKRNTPQAVTVSASERERLIKQIAKLDDDFEAGRIPEDTYKSLRSKKKASLTELAKNTRKGP